MIHRLPFPRSGVYIKYRNYLGHYRSWERVALAVRRPRVQVPYVPSTQIEGGKQNMEKSYFDGGLLQLIGYKILGSIVTVCTLGICLPWAYTMVYGWEAKHTVINGRRLQFSGSAIGLFGNWIKWLILSIITLGIYGFWVGIKLIKWKVSHTDFVR